MVVLDTNVISETQKAAPAPAVMAWLDAKDPTNLYLSAITAEELVVGVRSMPEGRRRAGLMGAVTAILTNDFADRILPFDLAVAWVSGDRVAAARRQGQAISITDGQIAAIFLSRPGAMVATRDQQRFAALGADVIDP